MNGECYQLNKNQSRKPTVFFKQLTERNFGFIAKSFHEKPLSLGYSARVGNGLNTIPLAQIILCILLCQRISSDQVNKRTKKIIGPPRAGFFMPAHRARLKHATKYPYMGLHRIHIRVMSIHTPPHLITDQRSGAWSPPCRRLHPQPPKPSPQPSRVSPCPPSPQASATPASSSIPTTANPRTT